MFTDRIRRLLLTIAVISAASPTEWRLSAADAPARTRTARPADRYLDAGDGWETHAGRRRLLRAAGSMAVRFENGAAPAELRRKVTNPGAELEGYEWARDVGHGYSLLKARSESALAEGSEATGANRRLAAARRASGFFSADPLFADPVSGLKMVVQPELVLRLREEVNAADYFGAAWKSVGRVPGTRDQYVLGLGRATAVEVLAEASRRGTAPEVEWVQPRFLIELKPHATDPLSSWAWHLSNQGQLGGRPGADVKAPGAWQFTSGARSIAIAVLDDGVQRLHPDLAGQIFRNPKEIPGNGVDDDGNGYVDDVNGWDFNANDNVPEPADGEDDHGTAVAGVAAAAGNNGLGSLGVAYGCSILPVKVLGPSFSDVYDLAEAIRYAAGLATRGAAWRGADVINLSLGTPYDDFVFSSAIWDAAHLGRGGLGCAVFASSGNSANGWDTIPTFLPIGKRLGTGAFYFVFEYTKDDVAVEGEDRVMIDDVAVVAPDGVTVRPTQLGSGGWQDFEGTFPPAGWLLANPDTSAPWRNENVGYRGTRSASSGVTPAARYTRFSTPPTVFGPNDFLRFTTYASCDPGTRTQRGDGLVVRAFDPRTDTYVARFPESTAFTLATGVYNQRGVMDYPAAYGSTIAVGASTDRDRRADYSQFGLGPNKTVDFLAPSSGGRYAIVSTDRTGTNGYVDDLFSYPDYMVNFGGTSAAAPLAAGVGALLLSLDSSLTAEDVRELMRSTCDKIGGVVYAGGVHPEYGHGRINAQRALTRLQAQRTDLRVTAKVFPAVAVVQSNFVYSITVRNAGTNAALNVRLTNTLSGPAVFTSASLFPDETPSSKKWIHSLGTIAAGQSIALSLEAVASRTGIVSLAVGVGARRADLIQSNNAVTLSLPVLAEDRTGPMLTLSAPTNSTTVYDAVQFTGTATDTSGVSRIEYRFEHFTGPGQWRSFSNTSVTGALTFTRTLSGLPPGTNVLRVRAFDAYGNASSDRTRTVFSQVLRGLTITINGPGTIGGYPTNIAFLLALHRAYTFTAVPRPGATWSNWLVLSNGGAPAALTADQSASFFFTEGLSLQANFVSSPFLPAAGSYHGLFYPDTGIEHERSGFFGFALDGNGVYSAFLLAGTNRAAVTGRLRWDGQATNTTMLGSNAVTVTWRPDLAGSSLLTGLLATALGDASALGDRAPTHTNGQLSPWRGKYTLVIPGVSELEAAVQPGGVSPAALVVTTNGLLEFSGKLADGAGLAQAVPVAVDGVWPLYVPLYQGRGSLLGWAHLQSGAAPATNVWAERVSWIKPALTNRVAYSNGFRFETNLHGYRYASVSPVLPLTNTQIIFRHGGLSAPFTNRLVLSATNTFRNLGSNALTLSLTPSNGFFSGTAALPAGIALASSTNRTLNFLGVILQRETNGLGYFLNLNGGQSGEVELRRRP